VRFAASLAGGVSFFQTCNSYRPVNLIALDSSPCKVHRSVHCGIHDLPCTQLFICFVADPTSIAQSNFVRYIKRNNAFTRSLTT
jgi:hypothetical protein